MTDFVNEQVPSLASLVNQAIDNRLKDVHTCMPGTIVTYDHNNLRAEVELSVKRVFVDRSQEVEREIIQTIPVLVDVPVMFPHGGAFHILFPVEVDDSCIVFFSERDFSIWYEESQTSPPGSNRKHSLSDSICFVGMYSKPDAAIISGKSNFNLQIRNGLNTVYIEMTPDGSIDIISSSNNESITIEASGSDSVVNVKSTGASGVVNLEANTVNIKGNNVLNLEAPAINVDGTITHTGNQSTSGDVTASGISLNSHVHGGVDPGSGTSGGPQ